LTTPISRREARLLFLATLAILIDCITTLIFQLTKTGTESNPILRMLLEINPLLVYQFLLSTLVSFFIFRFSHVIQTSITLFMVSIHTLASINNIGCARD
jgi:hypothetical protein